MEHILTHVLIEFYEFKKMAVFWVVLCSLIEVYLHFRGACCFCHQGSVSTPIMEAARTSEMLVNLSDFTVQLPGRLTVN
jgi:hypothetical protein